MHFKASKETDIKSEPNTENIPIKDIAEKGYAVIVFKFPDVYNDNLGDTDYESSFVAMTQALEGKKTYQLYRDYLDNFRINTGRN